MNNLTTFFVILALASASLVTTSHTSKTEKNAEEASKLTTNLKDLTRNQLQQLYKLDVEIQNFKVALRAIRNVKWCGKRQIPEVLRVCGNFGRENPTGVDMSECCHKVCTDEFIKKAMCPNKPI